MAKFHTYLNFKGNTEEAFNFYRSVFGGNFTSLMKFKEIPQSAGLSEEQNKKMMEHADKIMHICLPIGNGHDLMGTDSIRTELTVGNNVHISIAPDSREEADKLFKGLSEGGKIGMPLEDSFWGAYFGTFTDKFGIHWMVNFDKNVSSEK